MKIETRNQKKRREGVKNILYVHSHENVNLQIDFTLPRSINLLFSDHIDIVLCKELVLQIP